MPVELECGHNLNTQWSVRATSVGEVHNALWFMVGTVVTKGLHLGGTHVAWW